MGSIVFCPLAQGMLTDRYLAGIPADSRVTQARFLKEAMVDEKLPQIRQLHEIAQARGQSLAQMALTWVLRQPGVTSALIGASRPQQILDNLGALEAAPLCEEELRLIDSVVLK